MFFKRHARTVRESKDMGKITKTELDRLCDSNPEIDRIVLTVYLDARKLYAEASANIEKNGSVTGHPKTGAPMVNPYLSIREAAGKTLCKFHDNYPSLE